MSSLFIADVRPKYAAFSTYKERMIYEYASKWEFSMISGEGETKKDFITALKVVIEAANSLYPNEPKLEANEFGFTILVMQAGGNMDTVCCEIHTRPLWDTIKTDKINDTALNYIKKWTKDNRHSYEKN